MSSPAPMWWPRRWRFQRPPPSRQTCRCGWIGRWWRGPFPSPPRWFPGIRPEGARTGDLEDIAVLELTGERPVAGEVKPLPVAVLAETDYFDRSVRMCGFAKDTGDWVEGKLQGRVGTGWVQIDQEVGRLNVAAGFSGTAVWDKRENVIVGMIVSIATRENIRSGFMIPAASLMRAWPALEAYSRPPNPYRGLEAFREQDARNFMGRGKDVQAVLEALERPFIALVGASGSGKSSLLFAGSFHNSTNAKIG